MRGWHFTVSFWREASSVQVCSASCHCWSIPRTSIISSLLHALLAFPPRVLRSFFCTPIYHTSYLSDKTDHNAWQLERRTNVKSAPKSFIECRKTIYYEEVEVGLRRGVLPLAYRQMDCMLQSFDLEYGCYRDLLSSVRPLHITLYTTNGHAGSTRPPLHQPALLHQPPLRIAFCLQF